MENNPEEVNEGDNFHDLYCNETKKKSFNEKKKSEKMPTEYKRLSKSLSLEVNDSSHVTLSQGEGKWSLDLTKLMAVNSRQVFINDIKCYKFNNDNKNANDFDNTTGINEYFLQRACLGCNNVIQALWGEMTQYNSSGHFVEILSAKSSGILIPRELPPPQPKQETKWERFAKERGITPKRKRSRKVWDDIEQTWVYRTGFHSKTKGNSKEAKSDENSNSRIIRSEHGNSLEDNSTKISLKDKLLLIKDDTMAGIPVDLENTRKRGAKSTMMTLLATQSSTASMGKYDQIRQNEPERQRKNIGVKRKNTNFSKRKDVTIEIQENIKLLENLNPDTVKKKDTALRNASSSIYETGYVYNFNAHDNMPCYKKKKGRVSVDKKKK